MPAVSVAIPAPRAASPQLRDFFRSARESMRRISMRFSFVSEDDLTRRSHQVANEVCKYVFRKTGNRHIPFEVIIADTHEEAARAIFRGRSFLGLMSPSRAEAIRSFLKNPPLGSYYSDDYSSRVVIDLQAIREEHPSARAQSACHTATAIHETLHHLGLYDESYLLSVGGKGEPFRVTWFIEGVIESLTPEIFRELYPTHADNLECGSCWPMLEMHSHLRILVGEGTMRDAFFARDFSPIVQKLSAIGLSNPEIAELLQSAQREFEEDAPEGHYGEFFSHVRLLLETLLKRACREGVPAQEKPPIIQFRRRGLERDSLVFGAHAAYLPGSGVLWFDLPSLSESHKDDAMEHMLHAALTSSFFRAVPPEIKRDAHWFAVSYSFSKAAGMSGAGHHGVKSAPASAAAEIIGEDALDAAVGRGSMLEVLSEMIKAGATMDEVEEFVKESQKAFLGDSAAEAKLMRLASRIKRRRKPPEGEEDDGDSGSALHESLFGKLGGLASPNIRSLQREAPTGTFESAWEEAVAQGLLSPEESETDPSAAVHLLRAFNQDMRFHLETLSMLSGAYCASLYGDGDRASSFLEELAGKFESEYGVRPSVKQLMRYCADSIVREFSSGPLISSSKLHRMSGGLSEPILQRIPAEFLSSPVSGEHMAVLALAIVGCGCVLGDTEEQKYAIAADLILNSAMLLQCRYNIPEPTIGQVASAIGAFAREASKHGNAAPLPYIKGCLKSMEYPLPPPAERIETTLGYYSQAFPKLPALPPLPRRASPTDGRIAALYFRKNPREADARAFARMCGVLQRAYPAFLLTLNPVAGFMFYDSNGLLSDPVSMRKRGSGGMGTFVPYGYGRDSEKPNPFKDILLLHGLPPHINPLHSDIEVRCSVSSLKVKVQPPPMTSVSVVQVPRRPSPGNLSARGFATQTLTKWKVLRTTFDVVYLLYLMDDFSSPSIRFDMDSYRPTGCLCPEEVLERKYALCLEHTYLFLSMMEGSRLETPPLAFKVFEDELGRKLPHVCGGLVLDTSSRLFAELYFSKHKRDYSPYAPHHLFALDRKLRENVLGLSGFRGKSPALVLVDLSHHALSPQYQHILPMSRLALLSAYFTNAGTYFIRRGENKMGLRNLEAAIRINPEDELCRTHLVSYYDEIEPNPEKVLELSEGRTDLISPESYLSRALAHMALGDTEQAILSALRSLQCSEHFQPARDFLDEIGFSEYLASRAPRRSDT